MFVDHLLAHPQHDMPSFLLLLAAPSYLINLRHVLVNTKTKGKEKLEKGRGGGREGEMEGRRAGYTYTCMYST
jgi:hypothetical protein